MWRNISGGNQFQVFAADNVSFKKKLWHLSKAMTIFNWVNKIDQASKLINIQPLFVDDIVSLWVDPESRSSWTTFGSLNGSLPWRIETSLHIENKPIFDILPRESDIASNAKAVTHLNLKMKTSQKLQMLVIESFNWSVTKIEDA